MNRFGSLRIFALLVIGSLCFLSASVQAVPAKINFQGIIKDSAGNFLTGSYALSFTIYDAATAGNALWTEDQSVTVDSGLYNVMLGNSTALSSLLFAGDTRYLGVKVGTDSEMTPRIAMVSVPYAFRAGVADSVAPRAINAGALDIPAIDPTTGKLRGLTPDYITNLDGTLITGITSTPSIPAHSITGAQLANDLTIAGSISAVAVSASTLTGNGVGITGVTATIGDRTITSQKIALAAVSHELLADNSVDSNNYTNYSVPENAIQIGAVTAAKIANGAILREKISPEAIDGSKIARQTITGDNFANDININSSGTANFTNVNASTFAGDGSGLLHVSATMAAFATNAGSATTALTANNSTQLNGNDSAYYTNISNMSSGTLPIARIGTGTITNGAIALNAIKGINIDQTSVVTLSAVSATNFQGNGSQLTNITATMAAFATNANTANNATYFAGNDSTYYTNISNMSSGTIPIARIGTGTITNGAIALNAIDSTRIASGTISGDRLAANISINTTGNLAAKTMTLNATDQAISVTVTDGAATAGYFAAIATGSYNNIGVQGVAGGNTGSGLYGECTGSIGNGVYGLASSTTGPNYGGRFQANGGTNGIGVYGTSAYYGGEFHSTSSTSGRGIYSVAAGAGAIGVYGNSTAASGAGCGVFGTSGSAAGYGVYANGRLKTTDTGGTNHVYDVAELIPCAPGVEAADVVIVNANASREAIKCGLEYDPKVIGVISTDPQLSIGDKELANKAHPGKNFDFIALAGQVPCKVSNKNGAIPVGDLLTTSALPGYAVKAIKPGPIVAKALEDFDGSKGATGKILVFVNVGWYGGAASFSDLESRITALEAKLNK